MKRKWCGFLAVVMILTSIAIPTSVGANGSFDGDYAQGDNLIASFDASTDLGNITAQDPVATATFGGETFVYNEGSNNWLYIPMAPDFVEGETLYIKFRIHSLDANLGKSTAF